MNKLITFFIPVLIILLNVAFLDGSSEDSVLIQAERVSARLADQDLSQTKKCDDLVMIRGVLETRIDNHRLRHKAMTKSLQ